MSADMLFWVQQKRWLLVALVVGAILYFFVPHPQSLGPDGYHILIIILMTLILILKEPIPLPAIALQLIFWQVMIGGSTANEVGGYFMNDAVFFIMGSLMLAVAIVSQGLDKRLALGIIHLTGNKSWRIVAGFTAISAILSSFVGPHMVTAMMLPVALTLIRYTSDKGRSNTGLIAALLFSIAYGATIGSIGTPSGGGRNVIMMNYWAEFGSGSLSYIEWMKMVYPMVLIEIPITTFIILKTFPPEWQNLDTAVRRLSVEVAHAGKMSAKEIFSLFLFAGVLYGWIVLSEDYGLGSIALIGIFLFMAFGLVSWKDLSRGVNWGVILLFGATISIGVQMKNTGGAAWLAEGSVNLLQNLIPNIDALRAVVSVALSGVLSNLLSSSATVAVVGPVVLNLGGDPILLGLASVISSAFGYFTAVAAPACTIIYSSGLVKAPDFLRAGWKMAIMSVISLALVALVWWPLLR
ncbi:MAG: DASS family sodium-coupled anion symporter [Candidatus Marinimicrobia bacterium]|nr:DASS family sodium-coupled anion symporter [Candidatus Neomarinimicrobiota bacterium]MBT3632360.1 DASS family sodium-coupled anion symporter [Candidatus Neomarinimicrobiota bacterium]MBT3825808.1 DASS family sodium-coupled anion symporter [Candidatus Neomarinimicrobiota bacterium]MBT4129770.1 DASS family sodium-coupled anion symporter [Candidatus Neomarinimicrobiota bacterium]MBT4294189.1 DASS family sodium-coupled anion symporter [Candidatus Neomarinimicrobiota bacterium]